MPKPVALPLEKAGARPRRRGVAAVIRDKHGRYLLIQRSFKLLRAPGWWCFPGGEVNPGETIAAALIRELREELALDVRPGRIVHSTLSPGGEFRVFWMTAWRGRNFILRPNPEEVAEARFLSPAAALNRTPLLPALHRWLRARPAGRLCRAPSLRKRA